MKLRKISTRGRESKTWFLDFRLHGRRQRIAGFTDKTASEELRRKIESLIASVGSGRPIEPELGRWAQHAPGRIRDRLRDLGLLGRLATEISRPLEQHLAEWRQSVIARGNTERHVELVVARASRVINGCGFRFFSDIVPSRVEEYLLQLRGDTPEKRGVSAQTSNFHLQAVKQFCRWMIADRRASDSPLIGVRPLNVRTDRRHDRRALSAVELQWLLQAAHDGPTHFGVHGPERALIYRIALETGLRRGEIESLTTRSFDINGPEPTVTVEAAYSKHRRRDVLPLRLALAEALKAHLMFKSPDAPVLNVPDRGRSARMIRADLKAARAAWLKQADDPDECKRRERSDFLATVDARGRHADFHALRHTFISGLARGGVHPKIAQGLARHGTIGLTLDHYTHVEDGHRSALEVLPEIKLATAAAEGAA